MTTTQSTGPCDVTVVIPVRNGMPYVAIAIESVLRQTARGVKILLSDNGSSDGTVEFVQRYAENGQLQIVRQSQDLSMLEHFNRCIGIVDTKYYMLLCHDDFLYSDRAIEIAEKVANSADSISTVYCDMAYVDGSGKRIAIRNFDRSGIFNAEVATKQSIVSMRNMFGIPLLVRTRAMTDINYDPELSYIADIEFSHRVAQNGTVYHLSEVLIANRYHGTNSTRNLHGLLLQQMLVLLKKLDLQVSRRERLAMQLNAYSVAAKKMLFFRYLRGREAIRRALAG